MSIQFKDYFSTHAKDYSQYRPVYPRELFTYLATISPANKTCWDCATGNGQAAVLLSEYFLNVIATDASDQQIQNTEKSDDILYRVATAENSGIKDNSIDLLTVAQAFHWFDKPAFTEEVNRVLKSNGIIAIWTYNLLSINAELDAILFHLYDGILGDYWAFERTMVETGYEDIELPFNVIQAAEFEMTTDWDFSQLMGYLSTWSAVKKYQHQ